MKPGMERVDNTAERAEEKSVRAEPRTELLAPCVRAEPS
jgi:hypothetical protein